MENVISERGPVEEALWETRRAAEASKAQYELIVSVLVETANEAIVVAQDGMLKFVNRMAGVITGYSEQELTSIPYFQFIHPDDREMVLSRHYARLNEDIPIPRYSYRIVSKGGRIRWVEVDAVLIEWQGRIATLNFISDITLRKEAEDSLRASEQRYRSLFENSNDAIFIHDHMGRIQNVNQCAIQMLGYSRNEMLSMSMTDYFAQDVAGGARSGFGDMIQTNRVMLESVFQKKDGSRIDVEISVLPVEPGSSLFQAIVRDITVRKRVEDEMRRNRDLMEENIAKRTAEMERFIYTVSHDLRSPLVTMSGFVGLLKEDLAKGDSERAIRDLVTISGAVSRMDRLLRDILELSRIGRVVNPPRDESFSRIVDEAVRQCAKGISCGNVTVHATNEMPDVRVDVQRIVEVLVNLIENSIKYMGAQERPGIEIGFHKEEDKAIFFVKDNGIGIDPKEHEKVFGLFYKANSKSDGTGVGLCIVKSIIEAHGGRIWIESGLGKGCTVFFTLPLALCG